MKRPKQIKLLSQFLITIVFISNTSAAFSFMVDPKAYIGSFELSGVPGEVALIGTAILFIMWQVPYVFALTDPVFRFASLQEAIIMQTLGLVGESLLYNQIVTEYSVLRSSIARFIYFDGFGLIFLISAWAIAIRVRENQTAGGKNV